MKSIRLILVVALCILLGALFGSPLSVSAQDTPTIEPTVVAPVEEPPVEVTPPVAVVDQTQIITTALIVIGAVVGIAFGVFGYLVRPVLLAGINQMPPWAANMLFSAGDAGLDALEEYVEDTPDTTDDTEVAKLRKEFELFREQYRQQPAPVDETHG